MVRDEDISEFVALTNCPRQIARKFLANNHGALDYALNDFYDTCHGSYCTETRQVSNKLLNLLERYTSTDGHGGILTDGLIQFVSDLGLELEDPLTLCLAHTMDCTSFHEPISGDQFIESWSIQTCETLEDIRNRLEDQEKKLKFDVEYLETIYQYAFGLIVDPGQKSVSIETAQEYWNIFFDNEGQGKKKYAINPSKDILSKWFSYLKACGCQSINRDVWQMFFKFVKKYPTTQTLKESYSELDAWPLVIDEFYEYLEGQSVF
ncbi:LADA_0F02102g1_1 [Lachancea dasiensis]|uniref:Defective in cullin neddylation protein n=1 Tax=Lachancea dasiensis TaxID=1072105 RepID=A0A1G4JIG0_9SACH|nr:LADA_0F02102g1_1 [Lachancea dasiensis]